MPLENFKLFGLQNFMGKFMFMAIYRFLSPKFVMK